VHGLKPESINRVAAVDVPEDVSFLFETRYAIERELDRLARSREIRVSDNRTSVLRLNKSLVEAGVIDPTLENAIREVYSVCSAAIHGRHVTPAQVKFVKDVEPGLIAALRSME
jgi:hypothetical protein